MQEKYFALLLYGFAGLSLALLPLWVKRPAPIVSDAAASASTLSLFDKYVLPIFLVVLVALLLVFSRVLIPGSFLYVLLAVSVGVGLWHRASINNVLWAAAGTLLACTAGTTLIWWRRAQPGVDISSTEMIFYVAVLLFVGAILFSRSTALPFRRLENLLYISLYGAITAYFSF